jgi:hypothetical protein
MLITFFVFKLLDMKVALVQQTFEHRKHLGCRVQEYLSILQQKMKEFNEANPGASLAQLTAAHTDAEEFIRINHPDIHVGYYATGGDNKSPGCTVVHSDDERFKGLEVDDLSDQSLEKMMRHLVENNITSLAALTNLAAIIRKTQAQIIALQSTQGPSVSEDEEASEAF